MRFTDWYTDTADVWRVVPVTDENNLTTNKRVEVHTGIPCRIYQSDSKPITMDQTAASCQQADKLMCAVDADIQAGDQLVIHRGAGLGKSGMDIRAFAAEPNLYFEPFGAVIPGLAHMEVRLLQQERIKGGRSNDP